MLAAARATASRPSPISQGSHWSRLEGSAARLAAPVASGLCNWSGKGEPPLPGAAPLPAAGGFAGGFPLAAAAVGASWGAIAPPAGPTAAVWAVRAATSGAEAALVGGCAAAAGKGGGGVG